MAYSLPWLMPHASVVDLSRLDREALLKPWWWRSKRSCSTRNSEIEHLKLIIAKLRRMMFGTKSEKIAREVEQLELKLEELETGEAERPPAAEAPANSTARSRSGSVVHCLSIYPARPTRICLLKKPARRAVASCRTLGEDVSEMLEYIPASFKVIRHVRPKMCCTRCDAIVQAPAP